MQSVSTVRALMTGAVGNHFVLIASQETYERVVLATPSLAIHSTACVTSVSLMVPNNPPRRTARPPSDTETGGLLRALLQAAGAVIQSQPTGGDLVSPADPPRSRGNDRN